MSSGHTSYSIKFEDTNDYLFCSSILMRILQFKSCGWRDSLGI